MNIESQFRFIENVLKTMSHLALLKPGIVKAITFAANNSTAVQLTDDEYADVMDVFQDLIPERLIDPNQWWFGHYWSSGHTCSKCREISHLFPCDEPVSDQSFDSTVESMKQGHEPDCNARTAHEFSGLKVCIALRGLIDSEKSQLSQQEGGAQ